MEIDKRYRRMTADLTLNKIVIVSSVSSVIINCTFLIISAASGTWIFGHVFCQLFALLSQVFVAGSAWMITLAAMETCYRRLCPTEHTMTFSVINVRIIVYGTYLLLLVLHTSPLYGWGEYSQLRGGVDLLVKMSGTSAINSTDTNANSFITTLNQSLAVPCSQDLDVKAVQFSIKTVTDFLQMTLQNLYRCETRVILGPILHIVLRFQSRSPFERFTSDFIIGGVAKLVKKDFDIHFGTCNSSIPLIQFNFHADIHGTDYRDYKDIFLPFQEIGICSLDFSPLNRSIFSWIIFVISTSTLLPYLVVIMCGIVLRASTKHLTAWNSDKHVTYIIGAILGLIATVPYYWVNILNNKTIFVCKSLNIFSTIVYYSNSIFYILVSLCVKGCRKRATQVRGLHNSIKLERMNMYECKLLQKLKKTNSV